MTDLASWFLAQIAGDEAAARAAMDGSLGRWAAESDLGVGAVIDDRRGIVAYDEGRPTNAQAAHIARHDPARVLADCAAKRRIVELCATWTDQGDRVDADVAFKTQAITAKTLLRLLAQPYADREGFDPSWRVA